MTNLTVFAFEGQQVRFVGSDDKPEWVANDVVAILYPEASRDSYRGYLAKVPVDWKGVKQINTPGGKQKMKTLYEPGLYYLIGRSESPIAVPFHKWFYEDILPSIRKTGSYSIESSTPIAKLPSQKERLETIQLGIDLFQRLGGCDERTELLLKDHIRNILLEEKLRPVRMGRVEYPVSDRAVALGYRPTNAQLMKIGKEAVCIYQQRHGRKPVQREQFVAGTTRMVNVYSEADVDILDRAISLVMGTNCNA